MSLKETLGAKRFVKHRRSYERFESKSATPDIHTSSRDAPGQTNISNEEGLADTSGGATSTSSASDKGIDIENAKVVSSHSSSVRSSHVHGVDHPTITLNDPQKPVEVTIAVPQRGVPYTLMKILLLSSLFVGGIFCIYHTPTYLFAQTVSLCSAVGLCSVDLNVNYASLARGASIIGPLTSETYKPYFRPDVAFTRQIFRRPVLDAVPPSTILRSIVKPDRCWPLRGREGHVGIRLSHEIYVKSIVIVHLPATAHGSAHAAPRGLRVWGLGSSTSQLLSLGRKSPSQTQHIDYPEYISAVLDQKLIALPLVDAVYDATLTETHQTFNVSDPYRLKTHTIIVEVLDNWGNEALTCLYGLRVFGEP